MIVSVTFQKEFILIDTAGIRRKAKVNEDKKHKDRSMIKKLASELGITWSVSNQ